MIIKNVLHKYSKPVSGILRFQSASIFVLECSSIHEEFNRYIKLSADIEAETEIIRSM